ncbi:MAG: hypothetical protein KIA08_04905 [Clostridium baratii]|uniref:hypothetical protein n=1 Tax=Clostridium baratii TaxID=1561 RepID=UPI00242F5014|nr:hypothetical protein [Clostridium baratii]MBS6042011.1 hypothetical protein [Clostridium baratii]
MINKLFLDLNNFKPNLGSVERGDSIELNIKLLNDEDYSRSKFRLLGAKSDGKSVEQIEGLNLEEKDLKVVLEDQFVNCEGIVKLELNVVSGETEITTKEFYFFVSNTMNAEIIDSADSIPTLEKVSKYVDDAINNLETLEQAGKDITVINTEFKENEIKRKAAELLREKNEKARLQSEDIRITEEEEREEAELERIKAENDRKLAESNRKLAENTRVTNERAREEAELSRQSTFEENEEIRNSNENLRIASEKERIKFNNKAKTDEVNRKEAETKRVEAEKTRVIAEDERKKAETSRQEAEDIRQNTYTNFNEAEEERRNNEISRQEAEALRIEAEKRRDDLYSQKEEERNAAFLESERTRGTAFNEAQNDRNLTFEESERVREEAFKVSEAARNEAEEGRVAEELLRVEAEKNREVAEGKRVETESARVETEKLRVSAETERVEAENLRVIAEEGRVAAETKREEGFNTFEGKINANTEELKAARSATTGEEFNSLDERIDCEVDRLNKKIEVAMLQQEDKESHVIENSIEGMTTDMIVKGRILQNVMPELNKSNFNFTGETDLVDGFFIIPFGTDVNASLIGVNRKKTILKPNTKYTVIVDILENNTGQNLGMSSYGCSFVPSKNSFVNSIGISMITGTTKDNFNYVEIKTDFLFCIWGNGGDLSKKIKFKVMVLEGDWTNKEIPLYFEGIKSFGQKEDKISILSSGLNMVNLSSWDVKEVVDGKQCYISHGYSSTSADTGKPLILKLSKPIQQGENVTVISMNKATKYFNDFKLFNSQTKKTQTLGRNEQKNVWVNYKNTVPSNSYYDSIQIDTGEANQKGFIETLFVGVGDNLNYQEYKEDKKDILLSSYGFDEGLRGFSLSVCDELNDVRDVAIKRIGKSLIDETMEFHIETQNDTHISFYTEIKGMKPDALYTDVQAQRNSLSSNMPWIKRAWDVTDKDSIGLEGYAVSNANSRLYIRVKKSSLSSPTVEDFKELVRTWKENGSPFILYYELINPIETPLDENIALKVYNEKTYVSFENSINGTSSFKAPVNTVATITRLNRENRALEEENVKLKENIIKQTIYFENEDKKMTDYTLDMDFKMCLMEMDIEDIKANLGGDINAKK